MKRLFLFAGCLMLSCGPDFSEQGLGTSIDFEPNRPVLTDDRTVQPYSGADLYVAEAQEKYRTGLDIQRKIIYRTCTPFDGVCHNKKEYPDLHTTANFLDAIAAPCNVQPGDFTSVFDRCEPQPDTVRFGDAGSAKVGWLKLVEAIEGEESEETERPGLHLHLQEGLQTDRTDFYARARFVRDVGGEEIAFANFETNWIVVSPTHLIGETGNQNRANAAADLLETGIQQGDQNRNGVFGFDSMGPVQMIVPGNPEESYLIARIRGEMNGEQIPGSRMPLANQPLDIPDMLALFCYVEGLPTDSQPDLRWPIDYNSCSYSTDPEGLNLLGSGVTWATRISKVFEANCGGCHFEGAPQETGAGLDLLSEGAYERLLEFSVQNPEMKLVEPGDADASYLWLKLIKDDNIIGNQMPYNPLTGEGTLREAELGDVQTWIINGAIENE